MGIIELLLTQVPSPTPEPPPAELIEQATRVIDIWNSLGPIMAVLAVAALALVVVIIISLSNRSSNATAISVLATTTQQKDREIEEQKRQREQDRHQHMESLSAIQAQAQRANDLFEAMNNRGMARDAQQQRMVEMQAQIVNDLKVIATTGSLPVQEIKAKVLEIVGIVTRIDTRTADWNAILETITPLLVELGTLRTEAKKHKTQPIPVIDIPPVVPEVKLT